MKKGGNKKAKIVNIEKSNCLSSANSEVDNDNLSVKECKVGDKNPFIPPLTKIERVVREVMVLNSGNVPKNGHIFNKGLVRKAGDYLLGPILGSSPVKSMVQCLGRKKGSDEFYTLKILTIRDPGVESQDDKQGKMLLHTEHSLLSFLNGHSGILKEHGLFEDYACDATYNLEKRKMISNGKFVRRICLVLDCVIPNSFDPSSGDFINLQHYVIRKRHLKEMEALMIFYDIVSIVKALHDDNVIHRDLKLANLVLNRKSKQITLTNFCLGQHLVSENDKLLDQRGSPAYISPDVLIGKPYFGKPSDMWAMGVVLFTMLFGQFPFYHKYHQELFKMIKSAQYSIPSESLVKSDTLEIIRNLLCLDPTKRWTAAEVLMNLTSAISSRFTLDPVVLNDSQVVPDIDDMNRCEEKESVENQGEFDDENCGILEYFTSKSTSQNDVDKPKLSFTGGRSNGSYCYSTGHEELVGRGLSGINKGKGISIIEGDIRNFTQQDLYTHRSMFPHYSVSELSNSWCTPNTGPPPPPTPPPWSTSARPRSRVDSLPRTVLRTGSRSSLSSVRFPSPSSPSPMYEFPPCRRWALNVMQKMATNPPGRASSVPLVPQLSKASLELILPSTSRIPKDGSVDQKTAASDLSHKTSSNNFPSSLIVVDQSKPSTSGINMKKDSSNISHEINTSNDLSAVPGPSSRKQDNPESKGQSLSNNPFKRIKRSSSQSSNRSAALSLHLNSRNEDDHGPTGSSDSNSSNSTISSNYSSSNNSKTSFNLSSLLSSTLNSIANSLPNNEPLVPTDPNNNNSEDANNNNNDDNNNLNIPNGNLPNLEDE